MRVPKEIAEDIFLDEEAETIAICVDRVSLMLDIDEFMLLASRLDTARETLSIDKTPSAVKDPEDNVVPFDKRYSFLDDDEFH
tara:strand:- start:1243 stop:1491 length:249 start_codon:yes stop_codon:yes gene_type:complete